MASEQWIALAGSLWGMAPWLISMAVLMVGSGFFSASEAALFSLTNRDRRSLQHGNQGERLTFALLENPDRLLSAILFWNLVINVAYFSIAAIVGLQLEQRDAGGASFTLVFGSGALLTIIFFSEMLPKSLGVMLARRLPTAIGLPIAVAARIVDPLLPTFRITTTLSQRLIWPRFQPELQLEISDLERAIELSTSDAALIEQEQAALRNIVLLSDIRVDEWMRPRTQFLTFRPPVSLADLEGQMTPSGYLLVTEPDSEEVAAAIHLKEMFDVPREHLEFHAEPVVYVPWCATVADVLQTLRSRRRQAAAIVNEHGETIGILTFEDILDTLFTYSPSRSKIIMDRKPIHDIAPGIWLVAGVTSLRSLSRYLDRPLPASKSVTIAGVIQETLGRLAEKGDICDWGPFQLKVLETQERGHLLIELLLREPAGELP